MCRAAVGPPLLVPAWELGRSLLGGLFPWLSHGPPPSYPSFFASRSRGKLSPRVWEELPVLWETDDVISWSPVQALGGKVLAPVHLCWGVDSLWVLRKRPWGGTWDVGSRQEAAD